MIGAPEVLQIVGGDVDIRLKLFHQIIEFAIDFAGDDFQGIRRVIARQYHAVDVGDFTADGWRRDDGHPIAGGTLHVFLVFVDLQKGKAGNQNGTQHDDKDKRHQQTQLKITLTPLFVFATSEFTQRFHRLFCRQCMMLTIKVLKRGQIKAMVMAGVKYVQP